MRASRKSFSFISILLIGLLIFFYNILFSQKSITIDFSKKIEKKQSMIGFLHVNDLNPLLTHVNELKPRYWRVGNTLIDKNHRNNQLKLLKQYNIIPILVLTDFYSHYNQRKYDWKEPYKEPEKFADLAGDFYKQYGNTVIYDIWNEPNFELFWNGSKEDFFNTFKIAHDRIRSLPGGDKAIITGPSTESFDKKFIESFLEYCNSNNVRVDILNWHVNSDINDSFKMIEDIKYAKDVLKKKYDKVGIKEIYIPEIIGYHDQYNPLAALAYFKALEIANASGGCKACWEDPQKNNNCFDNSLDGILDQNKQPRSIWWVYKYYAESLQARLSTTIDSERTAALSYVSNNSVNVLFGNLGKLKSSFSVDLQSVRKNALFSKSEKINYKLYKIPNTEQKKLTNPSEIKSGSVNISSNRSTIKLDDINTEAVYLLKLSK